MTSFLPSYRKICSVNQRNDTSYCSVGKIAGVYVHLPTVLPLCQMQRSSVSFRVTGNMSIWFWGPLKGQIEP